MNFKYDVSFQTRIIAIALHSEDAIRNLTSVVEAKYFTTPLLSTAWKLLYKIYTDDGIKITADTLCMYLQQINKFSTEQVEEFKTAMIECDISDKEIVIKEVQNFCKQAEFLIKVSGSVNDIVNGNYDKIYTDMQELFSKDFSQTYLGLDYFSGIAKRYLNNGEDSSRLNLVPTGLELDQHWGGGLGGKEIGLVIGPTGRGKTAMLLNLAYTAIASGKNTLYVSCELSEAVLAKRMDSIAMSSLRALEEFMPADLIYSLKELQKKAQSKLIIKDYPAGELTVEKLHSYIKTMEAHGIKFDMVIVDYLGEMRYPKGEKEYQQLKTLMTQLRGLAYKLEVPIWTAHQTTRGSHDKMLLRHSDISDSFKIMHVCDIAFSMSASSVEFSAGYQRVSILKNRFGPTEITAVVKFNGKTQKFIASNPMQLMADSTQKAMELAPSLGISVEELLKADA
jgi:replicative DNA helicase